LVRNHGEVSQFKACPGKQKSKLSIRGICGSTPGFLASRLSLSFGFSSLW
jgi:hypothetical protein